MSIFIPLNNNSGGALTFATRNKKSSNALKCSQVQTPINNTFLQVNYRGPINHEPWLGYQSEPNL